MKFGAVPEHLLSSIDLSLPKEPFINTLVLPGKRHSHPRLYLGAATWGTAQWNGTVYPPKTPATKFRQLYPRYFNTVELNATHYRIYDRETLEQWALSAKGRDFMFCPKFPQEISHYSHFSNAVPATTSFLDGIRAFGNQLGPSFIQLSEFFPVQDAQLFYQYLSQLPSDLSYFVEFRHPSFFSQKEEREEGFKWLRNLGIGAVITDTPGRRDAVHMELTVPKLMLRFVCNGLHRSSFERTDAWVQQLKYWFDSGLEQAYIFLHPGEDEAVPPLASYWVGELNKHCQFSLTDPTTEQKGLFPLF